MNINYKPICTQGVTETSNKLNNICFNKYLNILNSEHNNKKVIVKYCIYHHMCFFLSAINICGSKIVLIFDISINILMEKRIYLEELEVQN